MEKEIINKKTKQDSFEKVKDVLESRFLKKLRKSNIHKALKLNLLKSKQVRVIYSTDQVLEKEIYAHINEVDEYNVGINNDQFIPIRAIKEIKF